MYNFERFYWYTYRLLNIDLSQTLASKSEQSLIDLFPSDEASHLRSASIVLDIRETMKGDWETIPSPFQVSCHKRNKLAILIEGTF